MNSETLPLKNHDSALHRVEFFRLPPPGERDPFFGLSRGWYYKAAAAGEIRLIAVRHGNASRGVRLIAYDSVADFVRRSVVSGTAKTA